jgi:hypothetical protein
VTGEAPPPRGRLARNLWLAYAIASVVCALAVLAIYVNTYDDYDVSDRLRAAGAFLRRTMKVLSFPLGWLVDALTIDPLTRALGCAGPDAPCSIFVEWQTRFVALLAQIVLIRWLMARRS